MSEQTEKKILSPEQAVQAACILFELNTREQDLLEMAQRAGVPCGDDASRRALTREWYGFVHAAVVYGLMAQASNQVMAEYLRSTRTLLSQMAGYTPEQIESFIDDTFSSYIRLMAQNQQKQCPSLFYQRLVGEGALETLPKERVAFLSGMMAITMCAILDKLGEGASLPSPEPPLSQSFQRMGGHATGVPLGGFFLWNRDTTDNSLPHNGSGWSPSIFSKSTQSSQQVNSKVCKGRHTA